MLFPDREIPWIDIVGSWMSLKRLYYDYESEKIYQWNPFLDVVIKLIVNTSQGVLEWDLWELTHITGWVKLAIEHLVCYDGISLRKLMLSNLRHALTQKWTGKVSIKNSKTDIPSFAKDFTDAGLKATWFSFIDPLLKSWKRALWNLWHFWNMSQTEPFSARLLSPDGLDLWSLAAVYHKWNKYTEQWDEWKFDSSLVSSLFWKPVIRSTSEIHIPHNENNEQFAIRLNAPVFWLNRDHARDTIISAVSTIHLISPDCNIRLATCASQMNLGRWKYETLIRWT